MSQKLLGAVRVDENSFSDKFEVIRDISTGSSSKISLVRHKSSGKLFAMKHLFWNLSPSRFVNEFKVLQNCNSKFVTQAKKMYICDNQMFMIFPFFDHKPLPTIINKMNRSAIFSYMQSLLSGLAYIHRKGIIHFDVKPSNFLFNPSLGIGKLVGFQYASFIGNRDEESANYGNPSLEKDLTDPENSPNKLTMNCVSLGTHGYKAPELLMKADSITQAVDVWSAGVVLLTLLTRRYPFFNNTNDLVTLCQMGSVLGTKRIQEAAKESNREIVFPNDVIDTDLKLIVIAYNPHVFELKLPVSIYDLLARMLEPSPSKRITAADALKHPFFVDFVKKKESMKNG